jgi:DNA-binding XRE family transcriptional regulator
MSAGAWLITAAAVCGVAGVYLFGWSLARVAAEADRAPTGHRAAPPGNVPAMATATASDARVRADLRNLRAALEVSQVDLALRSGVDVRTVRRVERDPAYRPRLEQLLRMADALNADVVLKVRE